MSSYVGRFAPSPTGRLHFGSVVTALGAYLRAKSLNGKILLRIEDLDRLRCKEEFTRSIIKELKILGFEFDGKPYIQSKHLGLYEKNLEKLLSKHEAFYCSCSRSQLKIKPCRCFLENIKPSACCSIRFKSKITPTDFFIDQLQGKITAKPSSKFLTLKRSDGMFSYNLSCVCDDINAGVTEVVRGEDLLPATASQIDLYKALEAKPISYLHLPLALESSELKISKQNHAKAVLDLESPSRILIKALQFLNQDLKGVTPDQKPAEILQEAIRRFNLQRIPLASRPVEEFWY